MTSTDRVDRGKNIGKANETTPYEQACADAQSKWEKKLKTGYVQSYTDALAGKVDAVIEGGIAPMLAYPYDKVKNFQFPCDIQRKLDGVRCIAVIEKGKVTLWSRTRKQIKVSVPHIVKALEEQFAGQTITLDGELYTPGLGFQRITSYVGQKTAPKEGYEQIEYWIYDVPSVKEAWENRKTKLTSQPLIAPIKLVDTYRIESYEDAIVYHNRWVLEGFEGAILRSRDAVYENKRSRGLVKLKMFEDHEFEIIAVGEGRGKFAGVAMLTCVTPNGIEFDCCAPGTLEERAACLQRGERLVGEQLTVKHFGWTDDGKPRFPVGKALRNYE
jgi:DNA ligase-1